MKLVRNNPFNEFGFWNQPLDRFFNDSFINTKKTESWAPVVDIIDTKENVVLNVELPGMKKDNIIINIEDRVLTISGERTLENKDKKSDEKSDEEKTEKGTYYRKERHYGNFKRAFTLSDTILIDEVLAEYIDGILSVTLKKDLAKEEVKQINIS